MDPDPILSAEFQYIAQTAFQANEDRARASTFYFVSIGTLVAALLGSQLFNAPAPQLHLAFAALFALLSVYGLLTLLQLVRLRQAWFDSVRALNAIKDYYIQKMPERDLSAAFRWTSAGLPAMYKPWSISFMQALQVAVLGGITSATAVIFLSLAAGRWQLNLASFIGLFYLAAQMLLYWSLLREKEIKETAHG